MCGYLNNNNRGHSDILREHMLTFKRLKRHILVDNYMWKANTVIFFYIILFLLNQKHEFARGDMKIHIELAYT